MCDKKKERVVKGKKGCKKWFARSLKTAVWSSQKRGPKEKDSSQTTQKGGGGERAASG